MTTPTPIGFRLPSDVKAWLDHSASANNRSMNGELLAMLREAMAADPLKIVVRKCNLAGLKFCDVSVGAYGDPFFEGGLSEALDAAAVKAKELGLPRAAIELRVENETTPPFGTIAGTFNGEAAQ